MVPPRYEYLQYPKVALDRVQRFGGLANPDLPWPSLEDAVDESAIGKLTRMTQAKFEEMDRLMVDMAIKLQVRPPGTSGGTKDFSAAHASQHLGDDKHDKQDVETEKELSDVVEAELTVKEKTENVPVLMEERTEEGETLNETPFGINRSDNGRGPFAVN